MIKSRPFKILDVVHASTNRRDRVKLWDLIELVMSLGLPLVVIGKFNYILDA